MKCKGCLAQGKPEFFASDPKCAFESGEFSPDNWNCATACELRVFMGESCYREEDKPWYEGFWVRRDDQSYGALWIPPNPNDAETVGCWRGGGLIAGYWYKGHGATDMLIRVDPRDGGRDEIGKPLTLVEAEAALENLRFVKSERDGSTLDAQASPTPSEREQEEKEKTGASETRGASDGGDFDAD